MLAEAKQVTPEEKHKKSTTPHLWLIISTAVVLAVLFGLLVWCLLCPNRRSDADEYLEVDKTVGTFMDQSVPLDKSAAGQPHDQSKTIVVMEDNKL